MQHIVFQFSTRWSSKNCARNPDLNDSQRPEHLKNSWKMWKESMNEENSAQMNQVKYGDIQAILMPDKAPVPAIPVADRATVSSQVNDAAHTAKGIDNTVNSW